LTSRPGDTAGAALVGVSNMVVRILGVFGALLLVAPDALAGDAAAGRVKAQQCQACHGIDGVGKMPDVPNIGGESADYLTRQLEQFRSGDRKHEQMSIIASGLSDEDIGDVAAWYSSIQFEVTVPQ
jgi:cytochrome c553